MKIYISGPMTGRPNLNKPEFIEAETVLRAAGFEVVNPLHNGVPDAEEWHSHMRADIKMLMDCEGVALLDGWQLSRGAQLEADIGKRLGMRVRSLAYWLLEYKPT